MAQPILQGADGRTAVAPEKIQAPVAKVFAKYAARNGYPVPLAEAMVRAEIEVVRFRKPLDVIRPLEGSTWAYFRTDRHGGMPSPRQREEEGLHDPETIIHAGELAIFDGADAVEYGFSSRNASRLEDCVRPLKAPDAEVRNYAWSWPERVSRMLLAWRFVLFLLGAVGIYFSIKIPGTGFPEALAVIAFGLYFGAAAIAGFASGFEMILFVVGIVLLAVEIFVIPGFGAAGIAGIGCILVSLALAALPEWEAQNGAEHYLVLLGRDLLVGFGAAVIATIAVARYLPSIPLFRDLALAPPAPAPSAAGVSGPIVGAPGVAETQLRPAGRARIDGRSLDVVADGVFVAAGDAVRVVAVRGNVVVVRPEPR
jgi:membrane-bound serine protease (ClpP class)